MDFQLTEEQQLVRASVKEFCEKYVEPIADVVDQEPRFPSDNVKRLAEQDWLGIPYPPEYGGAGADYLTYIIAVEELSRACAATGFIVEVNTSLACFPLYQFGTEEQKQKYLAPLCRGEMLGAFALTEPGVGTDVAAMAATAVSEGNEYVLNGIKIFVSNAPSYAGLSLGGEGYTSFTIASPTGEGLTTCRDFSRVRRWINKVH